MIVIQDISADPFGDEGHLCEVRIGDRLMGRFVQDRSDTLAVTLIRAASAVLQFSLEQRERPRPAIRRVHRLARSFCRLVSDV